MILSDVVVPTEIVISGIITQRKPYYITLQITVKMRYNSQGLWIMKNSEKKTKQLERHGIRNTQTMDGT